MKTAWLLACMVCLSTISRGQDKPDLSAYLQKHRYAITLSDPKTFAMLPSLMGSHNVLINGEGASHELRLYDTLQLAIRRQLLQQHLKVALIEYGRDMAYLLTQYLNGDSAIVSKFQPSGLIPYKPFRGSATFRVAGIDFERSEPFHLAVIYVLRGLNKSMLSETKDFITMITDSSYVHSSEKDFSAFYKKVSAAFTAQDATLRKELGDHYETLKYLCTNPNTTKRNENRNPALARNFLQEIATFDSTATYYCEIGNAHSKPNDKGSLAAILSEEPMLKGRLMVMNTYCEDCRTEDGPTSASYNRLSFMKGDRLDAFRSAATGSITLYDLSELAGDNEYMKESGSLLLFVRNHD